MISPGAILEIGLRMSVIPLNVKPQGTSWPYFSVYTHYESKSLFKELYLPYYVQNFDEIIVLDKFEDIK